MSAVTESRESLFFDLSARTKLKITGTDRLRFLNGQISNDARKATMSSAVGATVLDTKGKDEWPTLPLPRLRLFLRRRRSRSCEKLQARLERYIIADDVAVEDVTFRFSIFHALGTAAPTVSKSCRVVEANRFAATGWDIWVEMDKRDESSLRFWP